MRFRLSIAVLSVTVSWLPVSVAQTPVTEPTRTNEGAELAATQAPIPAIQAPATATQAPVAVSTPRGYSLRRCLALAEKNYPKIREAVAQLHHNEAELLEARTAPYMQFETTAGLTIAPGFEGTALYSPNSDVALNTDIGLAWRVGVQGLVPLWTFGKISNLVSAAEAQVEVGEHKIAKEKNEVGLSVRRAFYGVQLARDALALISEAQKRIDKYLRSLQEKVETGEGDDIELLKLKMHRAELDARESEARKQERVALAGLRFLTGAGQALNVPDRPLEKTRHTLGPLARYLNAARLFRPEINMAQAGIRARRAQVELEQSKYFPDLGIALFANWSRAPGIDDQVNPFVRDEANFLRYGAGLVLRWKMDFLPQYARVAQAQAQLEEVRATERFALGGVGVEVETAFEEVREATRRLDAYTQATRYAKQWLVKVQQGIDIGTFEDEDIVDPAREYALKRFAQMSATFDVNVALAKLALATGWRAVAPPD